MFRTVGLRSGQLDTEVGKNGSFASGRRQEVRPGEAKGFSVVTVQLRPTLPSDPCPEWSAGRSVPTVVLLPAFLPPSRGTTAGRSASATTPRPTVASAPIAKRRRLGAAGGRRWRAISPARAVPGGDGKDGRLRWTRLDRSWHRPRGPGLPGRDGRTGRRARPLEHLGAPGRRGEPYPGDRFGLRLRPLPEWSADGQHLAFTRFLKERSAAEVYVMDVHGAGLGAPRAVSKTAALHGGKDARVAPSFRVVAGQPPGRVHVHPMERQAVVVADITGRRQFEVADETGLRESGPRGRLTPARWHSPGSTLATGSAPPGAGRSGLPT